jgi:hypothetical protein
MKLESRQYCGQVPPGAKVRGIERQEHSEEVHKEVIPVVFRPPYGEFSPLLQFPRRPDPYP